LLKVKVGHRRRVCVCINYPCKNALLTLGKIIMLSTIRPVGWWELDESERCLARGPILRDAPLIFFCSGPPEAKVNLSRVWHMHEVNSAAPTEVRLTDGVTDGRNSAICLGLAKGVLGQPAVLLCKPTRQINRKTGPTRLQLETLSIAQCATKWNKWVNNALT
jgi:hypothetical protein